MSTLREQVGDLADAILRLKSALLTPLQGVMRRIYGWLWVKLPRGGGRRLGPWLMRKALWKECPVCRGLGWNWIRDTRGTPTWLACGWCWSTGYQYQGSSVGKPQPRPRS